MPRDNVFVQPCKAHGSERRRGNDNKYKPRDQQSTLLHKVVLENLETFLAEARLRDSNGQGVPDFVEHELRKFLRYGGSFQFELEEPAVALAEAGHPVPPPTQEQIAKLVKTIRKRVKSLLKKNGITISGEDYELDSLSDEYPVLAGTYSASVESMVALGERSGRKVMRLRKDLEEEPVRKKGRWHARSFFALAVRELRRIERFRCRFRATLHSSRSERRRANVKRATQAPR